MLQLSFQATNNLCVVQAMAAGITAMRNTAFDTPSGHGRSYVMNLHADTRTALPCTVSCHASPDQCCDQPEPAAAYRQDRGRCPSAGAFPAMDQGPTAARAPAPESGASDADAGGAAAPCGRIKYTRVRLLALRASCSALPLGIKAWPAQVMRITYELGAGQGPVNALHLSRAGNARGFDAPRSSATARSAACPALGLKNAARSWLGLPRELHGELPAALLTLFLPITL